MDTFLLLNLLLWIKKKTNIQIIINIRHQIRCTDLKVSNYCICNKEIGNKEYVEKLVFYIIPEGKDLRDGDNMKTEGRQYADSDSADFHHSIFSINLFRHKLAKIHTTRT